VDKTLIEDNKDLCAAARTPLEVRELFVAECAPVKPVAGNCLPSHACG
jgi:hypothetical protein